MKLGAVLSKNIWLRSVLLMMLLSFVGVLLAIFLGEKRILTSQEAREKTAYWRNVGFPEYTPQRDGWKVELTPEERIERAEALIELILAEAPDMIYRDTFDSSDLMKRSETLNHLIMEVKRLNLGDQTISDIIRRVKKHVENTRQQKVTPETSGVIFCQQYADLLQLTEKVVILILFSCPGYFHPIFHIPIFRLCSLHRVIYYGKN